MLGRLPDPVYFGRWRALFAADRVLNEPAPLASPADGPGGELRCGPGCGPGDGLRRCGPGGGLGGDQFV